MWKYFTINYSKEQDIIKRKKSFHVWVPAPILEFYSLGITRKDPCNPNLDKNW